MRDWKNDLELCEKAIPGPWKIDENEGYGCSVIAGYYEIAGVDEETNKAQLLSATMARFIAEARTGWPEALHRVIELEQENKKLKTDNKVLSQQLFDVVTSTLPEVGTDEDNR